MFDLLMYRNPVFSVRNVQIWVVLSSILVDLVTLINRFFRLRNGEIFIAILEEGRFADAQEFRFQAANISNTGIAVLQEGPLATS